MAAGSGTPPQYRYRFQGGPQVVLDGAAHQARFVSGFHLGDHRIADAFGSLLSQELADFCDVLCAVHIADRISPRAGSGNRDAWARRFRLTIPVRDPVLWADPAMRERLRATLGYLTEDDWELEFAARSRAGRVAETQRNLFADPVEPPASVALFSGGLDSLAGLHRELRDRPRETFVLFAAETSTRLGTRQRELMRELARRSGRVRRVRVPIGLRRRGTGTRLEQSQRSRGFIFTGMAAVTAIAGKIARVAVYENGIGAINLPYTAAQVGTHNTRSSHPLFLRRMEELILHATGTSVCLRLPFLLQTKAELCSSLRGSGWEDLVARTVSCDVFPQRIVGRPQCGVCTSCLLRRQALLVAGLGGWDPADGYRWDVLSAFSAVPRSKRFALHAMLHQTSRLRRLTEGEDNFLQLVQEHPQLAEVVAGMASERGGTDRVARDLAGLFHRYAREWESLPAPATSTRSGETSSAA